MSIKIDQIFFRISDFLQFPFRKKENPKMVALKNAIFTGTPSCVQSKDCMLSGHSIGSVKMVSNYTSLYRSSQDVVLSYLNRFPNSSYAWLKDIFSGKAITLNYHVFGSGTGVDILLGIGGMKEELDHLRASKEIEDTRLSWMHRLSLFQYGSLFGAGGIFAGFRSLAILSEIKNLPSSSLIGRINSGCVMPGMGLYTLFFSFTSGVFGIKVYESAKFKQKLNQAKNLSDMKGILQKKLEIDPKGIYEKHLRKFSSEESAKKALVQEALHTCQENLRVLLKELGLKSPSNENIRKVLFKVLESGVYGKDVESVHKQIEEQLMQIGLQIKIKKVEMKKQAKLFRLFDPKGIEAIKKFNQVQLGDAKSIEEGKKLVEIIHKSCRNKLIENGLNISLSIMGAIAMVVAAIFTSGTALLVSSVFMLIFTLLGTLADAYYLYESYRSEQKPASYDKKMLFLSTAIGIVSFLSMVVLAFSGIITMGIFPISIAIALSLLWIGQNGVIWKVIERLEKRHQIKNPTLENLLEAVQKGDEQRFTKMLENLPTELKTMMSQELKKEKSDISRAIITSIQKVEKTKQEHFELLRDSLAPGCK